MTIEDLIKKDDSEHNYFDDLMAQTSTAPTIDPKFRLEDAFVETPEMVENRESYDATSWTRSTGRIECWFDWDIK